MITSKDILFEKVYKMYCDENDTNLSFDDFVQKSIDDVEYFKYFNKLWQRAMDEYYLEITKQLQKQ